MKSILITGCNRGIGLGLVKHFIKLPNPPKYLIATRRDTSKGEELQEIATQHKNVHIVNLDVREIESYKQFAQQVETIVKDDGLNVLINNAGISTKFTRLNLVKTEQLQESLLVNTIAPIMLSQAMHPLLKKASEKNASLALGSARAAILNMSSILASIGRNDTGGFYPYRISKVALNAASKSMSLDLKDDGIITVAMHPGWVKTDMGGTNAPLDIDQSVFGIVTVLENLKEGHNGMFLQYDGKEIVW